MTRSRVVFKHLTNSYYGIFICREGYEPLQIALMLMPSDGQIGDDCKAMDEVVKIIARRIRSSA